DQGLGNILAGCAKIQNQPRPERPSRLGRMSGRDNKSLSALCRVRVTGTSETAGPEPRGGGSRAWATTTGVAQTLLSSGTTTRSGALVQPPQKINFSANSMMRLLFRVLDT